MLPKYLVISKSTQQNWYISVNKNNLHLVQQIQDLFYKRVYCNARMLE